MNREKGIVVLLQAREASRGMALSGFGRDHADG
jgi:hypothetical protein